MTQRFWFHVSISAAMVAAACLFLWLRGDGSMTTSGAVQTPPARAAALVLTVGFVIVFAMLLLRLTGSDRTMGLLGVYAVALYLPFVSFVADDPWHAAALLLLAAAVLGVLDVDLAPKTVVRSGLFASTAWVIQPAFALPVVALAVVVIAVGRPRWKVPLQFALALAVPWTMAALTFESGTHATLAFKFREAAALREPGWWLAALAAHAGEARSALENDFLSPYAALAFAGLVVATVRRVGPSRRGIAVTVWLFSVAALASMVLDERVTALLPPVQFLLLILLANMGLAALAAMNPLHAGRRRMIPVALFFVLPLVVDWVKLLF